MHILLSTLSFLLPTQLSYTLDFLKINLIGFKIDYLIPTLYLTDIIIFLIILLNLKIYKPLIKKPAVWLLVIFVVLNVYNSDFVISSIYKWIKLSEMILLGVFIRSYKKFDAFNNFVFPLSLSMVVVNFLGIFQFVNKSSMGGIFYYLGERSFSFLDPNVAPYPYSTFSHPNSFAGFLLVFVFFLLEHKSKFEPKFFYSSFLLSSINLLLTNSLNVYLTIAVLLILNFKNNLTLGFLFLDFSQRYITHRIELIKSSIQMIKENFFIGVGLNNFIPNLVRYSGSFINSWELQPVHNIFLLVFSETGVVGFLAFIVLLFASLTTYHYALISILITGMADHYWLTLQQNMLLFTYVVALSTIRK